jgi:hypothetical protein
MERRYGCQHRKIKVLGMRKHMKWDEIPLPSINSALEVNPP